MSVAGDIHLGFSYPVLVLVLVVPVIALVVRRKWRISVARSEEVRRLMVLASEEAARAELEAYAFVNSTSTASISPPLQYQYQCAVCFCPTTTRCARCKAVRYCSGKCQIVHWRKGHKEECRPFTPHQISDVGGGSSQKVLKQEDEIHHCSFGAEGMQCTKSVQNFPEKPAPSKSNCFPEVFSVNDIHEGECLTDGKGTNYSSHETERSDVHQRTNIFPAKLETNCVNSVDQNGLPSSKKTTFVGSVDCPSSVNLNQIKLNCVNHNIKHESASSSGWSAGGTSESTFSEPSNPSSGFWEGSIKSSRPKIDAVDDSALSSFSGIGDGSTYNVEGTSFDRNHGPPVDVEGSDTTNVISDGSCSATLGVKKPIDMDILSKERNENALKGKNSPLSISEKSNHMHIYTRNTLPVLKSGEPRNTSSSAYAYPTSSAGGSSLGTRASKVSSMWSLSSERSNCAVDGMHTTLHPLESEGGSLSTGDLAAHLQSNARRYTLQGAKSGKDDGAHAVAANSSAVASSSPDARNGTKTSMLKVFDQLKAKSSQHYQSGIGSEILGRYNNKGLFPYDLFVKLYNWNSIELQPCGLKNSGNTCYANAVLQCLACSPPLTAYFLKGLHSKACGRKKWCFTCELESLILKAKEGTSPLSPISILSQMQNTGIQLGNGSEEDAHEFLRYAIDTMQSVCLNEAGVNASGSLEEETTLIGLTFGGYLRSKIKCTKCGGKSERHERMMDLTVGIEGNIGTLEEALRQFTDTEILDGENKYQCSRCRSYERAKKKLRILEAPNVLTIALKRFQSGEFGKLNKSIRFPEILDLAPYMSGTSDKSPIYRLYAVVVHLDVMNAAFSGHYVCCVKNVQNKWFEIDDSTVKAVELESVLTKGAYMLLYARCSPRAPRLIRNSISTREPRKPKNPIKSRSHSTGPWDAYGRTGIERLYSNNMSFRLSRPFSEEDSLSDNSSSLFSEGNSHSTESSNRDSTSTDDHFDYFFGDVAGNWNSLWSNSSDSDSSSSSSSSSPSPLYSRHSSVAETDQYSSRYPETNHVGNPSFWERQPCTSSDRDKVSEPFLYSDRTKERRKLGSSSSCRETDSDRVGWAKPLDIKKSGLSLRRSMRERTD